MVSTVNWYNKDSVVSYARLLAKTGNVMVVYRRSDRKSFGLCHLVNLKKRVRDAHADQAKLHILFRTDREEG